MKDTDYQNIIEFVFNGNTWEPANARSRELSDNSHKGEIIAVEELTDRDLKFHKAYFSFISYVYDYLPEKFKRSVPKDNFYNFLKMLKGEYNLIFEFEDGRQLIEYKSIALGKMSQKTFQEYVKNQLPIIYEEVIGKFFTGQIYKDIIATIEEDYKKFLSKL